MQEVVEKSLYVNLGNTFGSAHHVCWIDRFVRGYHDKVFNSVGHGQTRNETGAHDIGPDGLHGMVLHHGYMLVRGRMVHIVGLKSLEKCLHAVLVAYIT